MATIIHKTFGINKKKGLQGFQFNYPYEGCVFDKTNQKFAEYKRDLNDNDLAESFKLDAMFFPRKIVINLKWRSIDRFLKPMKPTVKNYKSI